MTGESRQPGKRVSVAVAVAAVIWPITVAVVVSIFPAAPKWLAPATILLYGVLAVCLKSPLVIPLTLSGVVIVCLGLPQPPIAYSWHDVVEYQITAVFGCALGGFVLALCCEFVASVFHQWKRMREASSSRETTEK